MEAFDSIMISEIINKPSHETKRQIGICSGDDFVDKMRCIRRWTVLVLVMITAGVLGFLIGQNSSASKVQAEKELNYKLNLSDLDGLGVINGTIYVTGHRSPDTDTVGSSIAYAALLQKLGYDAIPVVLGGINNESRYVLETGNIEIPMLLEDASACNMILVDHSEYTHSAEGLQDAHVISIIDHHGVGSVTTGNQLIYDARPLGSTATIIWMRYRNYGVKIDPKIAYAMVGSILSDTKNLESMTTTFADREAIKELSQLAGIKDTDSFYREMYQASISYTGMTDEEIFFSDYKEYESGGTRLGIGCVNAYDEDSARDLAERMTKVFSSAGASTGLDMLFAQINILHDGINITFLVPSGKAANEVLETAFGNDAEYDGTSYRLEPGISRKKVLVPAINDILESYPKE